MRSDPFLSIKKRGVKIAAYLIKSPVYDTRSKLETQALQRVYQALHG